MNCDRCPHMKRIKDALKPCALCEAGRLHGQISTDSSPTPELVYAHARTSDHTPSTGVTLLDPDTEDALRKVLATMFELDPVELLLIQHVINGGTYANFNVVLAKLLRRLRTKETELCGKKEGFRSLAHSWAKKIVLKMPMMGKLLADLVEERR